MTPDQVPWTSYVAIGDSLTEGIGDPRPDGTFRGWADRLAAHLAGLRGDAGFRYANLAVRGRLLRPIIDEQVPAALALKPDLVSFWGGGNDALLPGSDPDKMAARVEDAIARLRAEGITVVVGLGTDTKDAPVLELVRSRIGVFNANIWSLARRHGALVMDTWGLRCLHDWRMWDADRIHLSPEGHHRVSQAALTALGLAPADPDYLTPLPPQPKPSRTERLRADSQWAREHLAPWVGRRLRRRSSGRNRTGKRLGLEEVHFD